ncbi:uncharacterized protein LOC135118778 [Helicoverpa armigera]|uniref:uncharacterized protein LOC135118778 n=1 Tax=Helicoverpa armigera TaxID=29058 RepID=UPI003082CE13
MNLARQIATYLFISEILQIRILHNVLSLVWLTKNIILVVIHSIHCEKFYFTVEDAEMACIGLMMKKGCSSKNHNLSVEKAQDRCTTILTSGNTGSVISTNEIRKLCKNVLRLHRASFSKIRACGLFYVDAALQLALMGLLTNYTIVLLQFAFL